MKSVKIAIILLFCFGLFFSLIGCGVTASATKEPPALRVSYQSTEINAVRGTYSWTTKKLFSNKVTNVDSISPSELVKKSTPLVISPQSTLALNFDYKPRTIEVSIWNNNITEKQDLVNGKIEVPDSKGDFVYLVVGTFAQGTVSYAFKVTVN